MNARSATAGTAKVVCAGLKGFTVYSRMKGGGWKREAWFARVGGVRSYAEGYGPGLGDDILEALDMAVDRWRAQAERGTP